MAKSLEDIELAFRQKCPKAGDEEPRSDKGRSLQGQPADHKQDDIEQMDQPTRGRVKGTTIVFYAVLTIMIVCTMMFGLGPVGNQAIGGINFYKISTTSMHSVYKKGSLIVTKEIAPIKLTVGDDIVYTSNTGELIAHRIEEIKEDYEETGRRAFVTIGVDDTMARTEVITSKQVLDKVIVGIPFLGTVIEWVTLSGLTGHEVQAAGFSGYEVAQWEPDDEYSEPTPTITPTITITPVVSITINQRPSIGPTLDEDNQPKQPEQLEQLEQSEQPEQSGKITPLNVRQMFLSIVIVMVVVKGILALIGIKGSKKRAMKKLEGE